LHSYKADTQYFSAKLLAYNSLGKNEMSAPSADMTSGRPSNCRTSYLGVDNKFD